MVVVVYVSADLDDVNVCDLSLVAVGDAFNVDDVITVSECDDSMCYFISDQNTINTLLTEPHTASAYIYWSKFTSTHLLPPPPPPPQGVHSSVFFIPVQSC